MTIAALGPWGSPDAWSARIWILFFTGYLSLALLLLSLSVTPLANWFGRSSLRRWRRRLGIGAAIGAALHGAIALAPLSLAELAALPYLGAGTAALVILLLLGLTSINWVTRRTPDWKRLHGLTFLAALLSLQHLALGPRGDPRLTVGLSVWLAVLLLSRLAWKLRRLTTRDQMSRPGGAD